MLPEKRKGKKVDEPVGDGHLPAESGAKKRKRSELGKQKRNVLLHLERPVTPGSEDLEVSAIGEDEEGLLVLKRMKKNTWRVASWSSRLGLLVSKGKDFIEVKGLILGLFWKRITLEMTPKDIVESFVINSVRLCLM